MKKRRILLTIFPSLIIGFFFLTLMFQLRSNLQTEADAKAGAVVIPQNPPAEASKNTLQLQTFPFITLTPTPTLAPTPTLQQAPDNPDSQDKPDATDKPDTPGASNPPDASGYISPNRNNCGGKYKFKNPIGNFGDPQCTYDKGKLYTLLKQLDPKNADRWFHKIIPCESSYNPNEYSSHASIGTPDLAGAWGLYQMGSSKPPGSPPPAKGKNGPYDRGDLNWQIQTNNAVTYGKRLKNLGAYWACAR